MDARTRKRNISKAHLTLLLIGYIILSAFIIAYIEDKTGYYGYQDAINYQNGFEDFRYEITHWTTILMMSIFGFNGWTFLLMFVLLPYAFTKFYGQKGEDGYKKTFELYFYSPLILLFLHENVYAQLMFTLFFVLYLTYPKQHIFEVIAIISHPAFIILFFIQHCVEKRYKPMFIMLTVGALFYLNFSTYQGYEILNLQRKNEMKLIDVLLYMNPINILTIPMTFNLFLYNFCGLFFHNGRFMIYAVMFQYMGNPTKYGKIYGLIINLIGLSFLL